MTTPLIRDSLRLVATGSAIACARLFVECTLRRWDGGFLVDEAVREVEGLVTAAVRATRVMDEVVRWTDVTHMEFIVVWLLGFETSFRIEVWDGGPNLPALPDDADSLIQRGCYPASRGKVVWVELPVSLARRKASPDPSPSDELERTEPDADLLRRVRDGLKEL